MFLRVLLVLGIQAVAMATVDDVIPRDNDVIVMPSPRVVFPGVGEYFFVGGPSPWAQAMRACESIGTNLTVIGSTAEAAVIRQMMADQGASDIHLGFHDKFIEGNYIDIFGQDVNVACRSSSAWAPGYPMGGADQRCGGYTPSGLIDTVCEEAKVFICEAPNSSPQMPCDGFVLVPDFGFYKHFEENPTSWTSADDVCRRAGTHLLIINSPAEINALASAGVLLDGEVIPVGVHRVFGGNSDFFTVLGARLERTGYTSWRADEPVGDYVTNPFVLYHVGDETDAPGLATHDYQGNTFICELEF